MSIEKLKAAKAAHDRGEISWEALEAMARPIVSEMNEKAAEIAKRHGRKAPKLTLGYVLRNLKLMGGVR